MINTGRKKLNDEVKRRKRKKMLRMILVKKMRMKMMRRNEEIDENEEVEDEDILQRYLETNTNDLKMGMIVNGHDRSNRMKD